jgi:hypothetical protein
MVFVELTPFLAFCKEYWTDEDLRALQNFLLATPDAGEFDPRWCRTSKVALVGARSRETGGARVIYYWLMRDIDHG